MVKHTVYCLRVSTELLCEGVWVPGLDTKAGWRTEAGPLDQEAEPEPDLLPVPQTLQLTVNVLLLAEALQQGDQIQQLRVRHVVEPGLHRDLRRTGAAQSV